MFAHFHTGTMTRVSPHLDIEQEDGYVEMNPQDAKKMGIKEGDLLTICSRRGELDVPARLTNDINPGTLFLPIHFGENPANILTSSEAFDPLAKIPEFKVSAVNVRKCQMEKQVEAAP
jgi:anaerobic selenocysteine-containing dehydrogenase